MIPRLAGWALKGLTGVGSKGAMKIGGRTLGSMGREAVTDAALIYGASQVPNAVGAGLSAADGSLSSDRLEALVKEGKQGDKYKITAQDQLGNLFSGALGSVGIGDGAQVTQKSVAARKQLNDYNDFEGAYKRYGGVADRTASRPELERGLALLKEKDDEAILKRSLPYQERKAAEARAQGIENITYNDSRRDIAATRAAADRTESNNLAVALAGLEFDESNANRKFDYDNRVLEYEQNIRKSDRRAKILSALGGLGMMFAI
jgi:hypothetical protein